jgi:hypothetical protein
MPAFVRPKIPVNKSPYASAAVGDAGFTIGAEVSNVITVAVQLKDGGGKDLAVRGHVRWFLSDDANGDSLVATAPDGGVAGGTDGWTSQTVTGKRGESVSEADGDIDIAVTHAAGAKTVYLVVMLPDGSLKASGALAFT